MLLLHFGNIQLSVGLIVIIQLMEREKSKARLITRAITLNPDAAEGDQQLDTQAIQIQGENVHKLILSEFKEKYDQLKDQFQAKKKEADALLYDKKKLEIELLNHNVEYYDKEITRLRGEVEKYQMENEEHKHRYFVAENSRKDLQAISKVRQDELKQTLKNLEKEKITVVELKHQLGETAKNYTAVIAEVEKTNHAIAQKYDQASAALLATKAELKAAREENQRMKSRYEQLQKALKEKEEEEAAFIQKSELSEFRSKHRIEDLEEELREAKGQEDQKIKQLEQQVKELQDKRKSEEFLLTQKMDVANYAQEIRKKEGELAALEEAHRELLFTLSAKDRKIHLLQDQLKNVCSIDLLTEAQHNYADALAAHKNAERLLEGRIVALQKEIELGRLCGGSALGAAEAKGRTDFQQLLKSQIEENGKLKLELSGKIDEVFALKNSLEEQQVRESLLENELDILRKKQLAMEKNSKIGFQIQLQTLRNDMDSLRRKLEVTEAKLAIKLKQVKDKDAFISSVIIGRSRQEDVPFVVAELKRIFEAEYVSKLAEANLKIQDLQARISGQ